MKKLILFIIFSFCLSNIIDGQTISNYTTIIKQGEDAYSKKDYKASLNFYNQAFKIENDNPNDLYNAACSAVLSGNKEVAIGFLNKALDNGYYNPQHLSYDRDLAELHSEKEWFDIERRAFTNQKKFSSTVAIEKIQEYIIDNNSLALWNLCSDTFKTEMKFEEFSGQILEIHSFIKKNGVLNFYEKSMGTTSYKLNEMNTPNLSVAYLLTPMYFQEITEKLLLYRIGNEINIDLKCNKTQGYQISALKYRVNLLDENFNLNDYIVVNFSKAREIDRVIIFHSPQNYLLFNTVNMSVDELDVMNKFEEIKYIGEDNLQEYKNENKIYALFFKPSEGQTAPCIELIFSDHNNNNVLIIANEKYAFFKINGIENLKKYIKDKSIVN